MIQLKKRVIAGIVLAIIVLTGMPLTVEAAVWKKDNTGWYLLEDDGSKAVDKWATVGGKKYCFDSNGYMRSGWYWDGSYWYYLGSTTDGAMKTGWQKIGQKWYYMYSDGKMASNTWIDNKYWVNKSGEWVPGEKSDHWIQVGSRWWYRHAGGGYTTNAFEIIKGKTYYFDSNGWMVTGWQKIDGSYYYFGAADDGSMKTNRWIGHYYVGEDGIMATDQWIGDYYVDSTGKWDKSKVPSLDDTTIDMDTIRAEMLAYVNKQRAENGLEALQLSDVLNETAQIKAKEMADTGVLDHYSENLGYFYDQYNKAGIDYWTGAENIAAGHITVIEVMNGWMNSSAHKDNILGADFTHLGIGYYDGYWVQQFMA